MTAKYKQLQKECKDNQKFVNELAGNLFGIVNVGAKVDIQTEKITNDLRKRGIIDIEVTTNPDTFSKDDAAKYMQPILAEIRNEIFGATNPFPEKLARTAAAGGTPQVST